MQRQELELFTLRNIQEADYTAMRALYVRSLAANLNGFIQPSTGLVMDIADFCAQAQKNGGVFVGLFEGKNILIGFGGLSKKTSSLAELCKLHLDQDYQGRGLGQSMLQYLLERAKGCGFKMIELHVTTTQKSAIALYHRNSFQQTKQSGYTAADGTTYDTVYMQRHVD